MITATPQARQSPSWQQQLADAYTDPAALLAALDLDPGLVPAALAASELFELRVPHSYVARMRPGDPHDPLLRQVLPIGAELRAVQGFVADPLDEAAQRSTPGLLQKYRGRALLITTGACAVNCRYCFRREFPYSDHAADSPRWSAALARIAADTTVEEVILSGGDPLALGNARLAALTQQLARVPHIRRLRIHTRTPIVLPARIDAEFLEWLDGLPWPIVIVLHANHAREIDAAVSDAISLMRRRGILLLNQSVLLRGVNDDVATLAALSEALYAAGVLPYYLHLLDRVSGTSHFEVPEATAGALLRSLAGELPGYLVPRLVREVPGAASKFVLGHEC